MGPSSCTDFFKDDDRVDKAPIIELGAKDPKTQTVTNAWIQHVETGAGIDDSKHNYNRDALTSDEKMSFLDLAGEQWKFAKDKAETSGLPWKAQFDRNFALAEGFRISLLPFEAGPSGGLLEQALVASLMIYDIHAPAGKSKPVLTP